MRDQLKQLFHDRGMPREVVLNRQLKGMGVEILPIRLNHLP